MALLSGIAAHRGMPVELKVHHPTELRMPSYGGIGGRGGIRPLLSGFRGPFYEGLQSIQEKPATTPRLPKLTQEGHF